MSVCRPVYKQDGGENYVYYSSAGLCWLVGCLVGHRFSWLRNSSPAAPNCRYPSLLSSGWEVRTDTAGWTEADQDSVTFHNIKGIPGQVRSGQGRAGQVRSGVEVRSGQVRSGQVRSGRHIINGEF